MTARPSNPDVAKLAGELFAEVQQAQGFAFCSDGEEFATVPEFFARIRGRLQWNDEASKIMRAFLKRHEQYGKQRPIKAGPRRY